MSDNCGFERLCAPWRMEYIATTVKPSSDCVFCTAADDAHAGEFYVVFRGENCFIILNAYPYNNGHLLVIPYQHTAELGELSPNVQTEMWHMASLAVEALKRIMHPDGFNLGINLGRAAGAGIAEHLHLHIVPRWSGDTNFMPVIANTRVLPESLQKTWEKVKAAFLVVIEETKA